MTPQTNKTSAQHGMTLIELMVSVAIMSIMVLSFGHILSNTRKLVAGSHATMRGNTAATAMANAFRQDIRRASMNGFLCINTLDTNGGNIAGFQPQLFLTVAGPVESITSNALPATGGIVGFGQCTNNIDLAHPLIWRAAWQLTYNNGNNPSSGSDAFGLSLDLTDYQAYTRGQIDSVITPGSEAWRLNKNDDWARVPRWVLNNNASNLSSPPANLTDVNNLWKCLAVNSSNLSIAWTDGAIAADGTTMVWYSKDYPKDPNWASRGIATASPLQPEYNAQTVAGQPALYRALWTHENQSNWPKQVKIRFTLQDPDMPSEIKNGVDYEVICPIGQ